MIVQTFNVAIESIFGNEKKYNRIESDIDDSLISKTVQCISWLYDDSEIQRNVIVYRYLK